MWIVGGQVKGKVKCDKEGQRIKLRPPLAKERKIVGMERRRKGKQVRFLWNPSVVAVATVFFHELQPNATFPAATVRQRSFLWNGSYVFPLPSKGTLTSAQEYFPIPSIAP